MRGQELCECPNKLPDDFWCPAFGFELEGERAVVTLGDWLAAGDLQEGRTLPAYAELARVLEPWQYGYSERWGGFSREDIRRWERRFLD